MRPFRQLLCVFAALLCIQGPTPAFAEHSTRPHQHAQPRQGDAQTISDPQAGPPQAGKPQADSSDVGVLRGGPEPSIWSANWGQPGILDTAIGAGLFGGALAIQLGADSGGEPNWTGPITTDRYAHDSLLADTVGGANLAASSSDIFMTSLVAAPLVLEPGLTWLTTGNAADAGRLALIDAEALAATFFATVVLKHTIGRQRPPEGACWDDPNANGNCGERDNLSFPSGHASMAFAGAGLVCLNHEQLSPLGPGWDNAACYTALAAAAATATFRMVANKHYLTDVLAGAALGLAGGYFLPKWLYFGFGDDGVGLLSDHDVTVSPSVGRVNGINFSFTW